MRAATGAVLAPTWAIRPRTKRRLRTLALETPSVYDLLPTYPCVTTSSAALVVGRRRPTSPRSAATPSWRPKLKLTATPSPLVEGGGTQAPLFTLVGEGQPTLASFSLNDGECEFSELVDDMDWAGDGTVHFGSAYPKGAEPTPGFPRPTAPYQIGGSDFVRDHQTARRQAWTATRGRNWSWRPRQRRRHRAGNAGTRDAAAHSGHVSLERARDRTVRSDHVRPPAPHLIQEQACERRRANHAWNTAGMYTITVTGGGTTPLVRQVLVEPEE